MSGHARSVCIDHIIAKSVPRDLVGFSASNEWLQATLQSRSGKCQVRSGQVKSGHVRKDWSDGLETGSILFVSLFRVEWVVTSLTLVKGRVKVKWGQVRSGRVSRPFLFPDLMSYMLYSKFELDRAIGGHAWATDMLDSLRVYFPVRISPCTGLHFFRSLHFSINVIS